MPGGTKVVEASAVMSGMDSAAKTPPVAGTQQFLVLLPATPWKTKQHILVVSRDGNGGLSLKSSLYPIIKEQP
jgi:hypothetical protein